MYEEKVAEKAKFYEWLDLSEEERVLNNLPLSKTKMAEHLSVSAMTLIKWEKKRGGGGNNGQFNLQEAFRKDYKKIWDAFIDAVNKGKINAQLFRTFAQLANELVEKREDTVKFELTANDRITIARETVNGLREEYKRNNGYCSVCGQSPPVPDSPLFLDESKFSSGREVGTVAVSP